MNRQHPFFQLLLARMREFYREPAVLFWVYGFPLFLALGLGVAFSGGQPGQPATTGAQTPALAIQGKDSDSVQDLRHQLEQAGLRVHVADEAECRQQLRTGKIALYVVPTATGYDYCYDPARPDGLTARYQVDDLLQRARLGTAAVETHDLTRHEPGSRYIDFLIPGLMGLNLMAGGLWGVGYVIVELRVRKLLKFFLATPMRRSDFLLSVLTSRLVFLIPEMLLLLLAGWLAFGVPMRGAPLALVLLLLTGGATFAGLGLLLASRTEKTEVAAGLINLVVLPLWMVSGTFFTYERFPRSVQPLIQALPLTQLNDGLREVMLEGASLALVTPRLLILSAWAVVSFLLALRLFRWL